MPNELINLARLYLKHVGPNRWEIFQRIPSGMVKTQDVEDTQLTLTDEDCETIVAEYARLRVLPTPFEEAEKPKAQEPVAMPQGAAPSIA